MTILMYTVAFLYGIIFGSFLNVLILRIPSREDVIKVRSHCMSCGYQLRWYDLIPIVSYICLGGKCRNCKKKISVQYPLIEGLNGILYMLIFAIKGWTIDSLLCCLLFSALLVLSVIDFRTYEIPIEINFFILALGVVHTVLDYTNWLEYVIGLICVSLFLYLLYVITKGRGIGGGDIKLMAVCGLFLGWRLVLFAFITGCILGSVIHILRMKISGEGKMLALGPYLSAGVIIATLWGEQFINWYLGMFI